MPDHDIDSLIHTLEARIEQAGSLREWARRHKLSPSYVSMVLGGKRPPGPLILEPLGYRKVVVYRAEGQP